MNYNPENGDSAGMGTDSQFPYMIKAEFDGDHTIKVTPLKIPEVMDTSVGRLYTDENVLYLCLEISTSRAYHCRHRNIKSPHPIGPKRIPTSTGKFFVPYGIEGTGKYAILNPVENNSYYFDTSSCIDDSNSHSRLYEHEPRYVYVRGCYRLNASKFRMVRTRIHSNTIKITE